MIYNTLLAISENNKIYGTLIESDRLDIQNLKDLQADFFKNTIDTEIQFFNGEYISDINLDDFSQQIATKIIFDKDSNEILVYNDDKITQTIQGENNVYNITETSGRTNNITQTANDFGRSSSREFERELGDGDNGQYNIGTDDGEEKGNLIQNVGYSGEFIADEFIGDIRTDRESTIEPTGSIRLSTQQGINALPDNEFPKFELGARIDNLLRSELANKIISNFISNFNGTRIREIGTEIGGRNQARVGWSDNDIAEYGYDTDDTGEQISSEYDEGRQREFSGSEYFGEPRYLDQRDTDTERKVREPDREFADEQSTNQSELGGFENGNDEHTIGDNAGQEQFTDDLKQSETKFNDTNGQGDNAEFASFDDTTDSNAIFNGSTEQEYIDEIYRAEDNADNSNISELHSQDEPSGTNEPNQTGSDELSKEQSVNQTSQTVEQLEPDEAIKENNKLFLTFSSYQFLVKYKAEGYKGKFDFNLTKKERVKANYEALKLTQIILTDINRKDPIATPSEQEILAKFSGYGGLKEFFVEDRFQEQRSELLELVGQENFDDLMRSSENAYYTPDDLITRMYDGLNELGVSKKEKVYALEPSCGIGRFISLAPSNFIFEAIEKDKITATIAKLLHPNIKIYNDGFENVNTYREYDVVVGNPPFGQDKINDYKSRGNKQSIHNYFAIRAGELIKEGGVVSFVISSYFLDSSTDTQRSIMSENGEFISAFRLPSSIFQHTEVLTDVFYYTKLADEEKGNKARNSNFLVSSNRARSFSNQQEIGLNEYFDINPQNLIGLPDVRTNQFGQNVLALEEDSGNRWQDELRIRIHEEHEFRGDIFKLNEPNVTPTTEIPFYEMTDEEVRYIYSLANGNLFEFDGKFYVKDDENNCHEVYFEDDLSLDKIDLVPKNDVIETKNKNFTYKSYLNHLEFSLCKKIVAFRDKLKEVLNDEKTMPNDDNSSFAIEFKKQALLNMRDEILKDSGAKFLNSNTRHKKDINGKITMHNLSSIIDLDGIDSYKIYATENEIKDKNGKKSYVLSDFMRKRVLFAKELTLANDPVEALAKSINDFGKLQEDYLTTYLPSMSLDEILTELTQKKLIFKSLENNGYELASEFLSGNVKAKHAKIVKMINDKISFDGVSLTPQEVANELEAYFPDFVNYEDLEVNFGSNYVDIQIYEDFIRQTFFYEPEKIQVKLEYIDGTYVLNDFEIFSERIADDGVTIEKRFKFATSADLNDNALNVMVKNEAGEIKFNTRKILELVINNQSLEVKRYEKQLDGSIKTIIELAPTKQAMDNAEVIKELFDSYCFNNEKVRDSIEQSYNQKINVFASKNVKFDEYLKFDDLNNDIKLRPHQKDAVYKGIMKNSLLLDHQVGAGKTLASIAIAMEQKRMGIIKKALVLVPNHLTRQWADEFLRAYPAANILVGDKIDSKKARKEFLYKARFGEFDAIIMKHSTFENMNVMQSYQEDVIRDQIENLTKAIEERKGARESEKDENKFQMYLNNQIAKLKRKLEKQAKGKKFDEEIAFEDLGIDALFVDEAHNFKNLFISTNLQGVKGLPLTDSDKAMKMLCATRYCIENGYKLYFMTGTPVSNSISEFYIMQNYLQPQVLKELGLSFFDDWQKAFTKVTLNEELDSSGVNYKIVPRLAKFINVPELMNIYKQNTDIVSNEDIESKIGKFVPSIKGNTPTNIIIPRSDEIANFIGVEDENGNYNQGSIIYRMDHIDKSNKKENILSLTTEARKAALDYRMIDPFSPKTENSKIAELVRKAIEHYKDESYPNGTQLIFCDMGVSKQNSQKIDINSDALSSFETLEQIVCRLELDVIENEDGESVYVRYHQGKDGKKTDKIVKEYSVEELIEEQGDKFDVYADILKELVKAGVAQEQIAFIGDAKTDIAKQNLFEKMNRGEIRFLIGSTSKMGAGTNVQRLGVAMHELDCPWRPCDLQQRLGRFIRQGNYWFERDPNFEMSVYRYATEQTYDARMFQVNEQKLRPLAQIKKGNFGDGVRVFDSIDAEVANIAEMKAYATGNMFVLEKHRIANFIQTEERLYENYKKSIIANEKNYKKANANIVEEKEAIDFLRNIVNLKIDDNENYAIKAFGIDTTRKAKSKEDENDFRLRKEKITQILNKFARGESGKDIVALELKGITLMLQHKFTYSMLDGSSKSHIEGILSDKNDNTFAPQNLIFTGRIGALCVDISYDGMLQRVENTIKNANHIFNIHNNNLKEAEDKAKLYGRFLESNKLDNYNRGDILKTLKEDLKNINEIFRIRNELRKQGIVINDLNAEQIADLAPKYPQFLNKNGKLEPKTTMATDDISSVQIQEVKEQEQIEQSNQSPSVDIQIDGKIEPIEIKLKEYREQDTEEEKFNIILENDRILKEARRAKSILG